MNMKMKTLGKVSFVLFVSAFGFIGAQSKSNPQNLIRGGDMEMIQQDGSPWAGVMNDSLRVFVLNSTLVDQTGEIRKQAFPPSIAAGDLNGDGVKDLLVADSYGYYWIYLNRGTAKEPKFTRGELLPFWIKDSKVQKIHLTDVNGDNILDLVIGDFTGRLMIVRNTGTANLPKFPAAQDTKEIEVRTDSKGRYWCNYIAPFYVDWDGDGKKDLIMGEGSFSANNIFFLKNTGSTAQPNFDSPRLLISGEGKEHLTPQVLDWNGDGKLDIVTGERDKGIVSVFLNTSIDQANGPWTFSPPSPIKINTTGAVTMLSAPVFEDMNADGLPDLLLGTSSGNIRLSVNSGVPKDYKFEKLENIKGVSPLPNFVWPTRWIADYPGGVGAPESARFQQLRAVTKNDRYKDAKNLVGFDPEFELPKESAGKTSLVFDFVDPKQEFIPEAPRLLLGDEGGRRYRISYPDEVALKPEVTYELSFQSRGTGFGNCEVHFNPSDEHQSRSGIRQRSEPIRIGFNFSSSWTSFSRRFKVDSEVKDKEAKKKTVPFRVEIILQGDGVFFLDEVSLVEKTGDTPAVEEKKEKKEEKKDDKKDKK